MKICINMISQYDNPTNRFDFYGVENKEKHTSFACLRPRSQADSVAASATVGGAGRGAAATGTSASNYKSTTRHAL